MSDSVSTPTTVPDQYTALQGISYKHLHGRLLLLNNFSNVVYNSWRFLNLQPDSVCVTYVYACMCAVGSLRYQILIYYLDDLVID